MRTKSGNLFLKKSHSKTFNRGHSVIKRPKLSSYLRFEFLGLRNYLIISTQYARITAGEIESVRKILRRLINKRLDKLFVRIYPFITLTKKPTQSRMGRGKGARSGISVCYLRPGKVLFEIKTTRRNAFQKLHRAYLKICPKLSLKTSFIQKKRLLFS